MKTLHFASWSQPTLELEMPDGKTRLHVLAPSLDEVEAFRLNQPELRTALLNKSETAARETLYGFAAQLMSCNTENMRITAKDLYRFGLNDTCMYEFFRAYNEFLAEIDHAKN